MGLFSIKKPAVPGAPGGNPNLNPQKVDLIDYACGVLGARTIADLGAVWTVDGGYCTYAIEKFGVDPAFAVDAYPSDALRERAARTPQLRVISGNFGDPNVAEQIGRVDAIILFDVLVVQVRPNWDEILEMYAPRTESFLVFNPQFLRPVTMRLMDLSPDEYFRMVPADAQSEPYKTAFARPDDPHPSQERPYRDSFDLWQWAITDRDLTAKMQELGFRQHYFRNWGNFLDFKHIENHAFVFAKEKEGPYA